MMRLTYIILFSMLVFNLVGQDISKAIIEGEKLYHERKYKEAIPILEKAISNYRGDVQGVLIEAHLILARNYMHSWDSEGAKNQYVKAWDLSKNLENEELKIQAGISLTALLSFQQKSDSLKLLINEVLNFKNLKHNEKSDLYIEMAGYYEDKEKIDSAIYYGSLAATIDSIHQDSSSIPYTYYDLGNYYLSNNDFAEGISKILYGLNYIRGEKDAFKRNTIEIGLSSVYYRIGNIVKAEELVNKVLASSSILNQQVNQTNSYNILGDCAAYMNSYELALKYFEKSDSINQSKVKNTWRSVRAKISIIEQKLNLGRAVDETEIENLLKMYESIETTFLRNKIGFLKLRISNYSLSKFETEYAKLYNESGAKENVSLRRNLLKIKEEHLRNNERYKDAFLVSDELDRINKEINLTNNKYIIQDLEAKHRKKEQKLQIQYLDDQNSQKQNRLEEQKTKIIAGSVALILISLLSFFMFKLYRKIKHQKGIISKALSEKDLLLREIHHRVKNNLQLVSSLLTLQGRSIDDEVALQAINEGKSRVRSMALIHQDLYSKDNLTGISVKTYLQKLTQELFSTYSIDKDQILLKMNIQDLEFDVDVLVPLGLIINELITNSLKYAFPDGKSGVLDVNLQVEDQKLVLTIADDGIGFDQAEIRDDSFGSTLVRALTEQLEGSINVQSSQGTLTTIVLENYN